MFGFTKFKDGNLEVYEFSDGGQTAARFVPARGGMITEYELHGRPLFYLDRETLLDSAKNVRGGNPVLFPVCGPLEDGRYVLPDRGTFRMKQHGLARDLAWEPGLIECGENSAAFTLRLDSDDKTKEIYPFDFSLQFTYVIERDRLIIKQQYYNTGVCEMPFYAGFHPYFYLPGRGTVSFGIPSSDCHDLRTGRPRAFTGELNLETETEINLQFGGLRQNSVWFDTADGCRITVEFDGCFRYVVLWALKDRDFLCVEPWMGQNYDLNRGKARILKPGEKVEGLVYYKMERRRCGLSEMRAGEYGEALHQFSALAPEESNLAPGEVTD